jgi:choline-sulfatase
VETASGRPPNLLFIVVDQLGARWLPPYGHRVVQAPSTAALARSGVVFESAYCPSPLCAPSRAALLTGRLPSRTEVFDNGAELRASLPTVAHRLRAAGYATSLAGKMHFVGPDQLHGFEERLTTDIYPADLSWTPDWRRAVDERLAWYHTMESVLSPAPCAASMQLDYDDELAFRGVRRIFDFARAGAREPFFLLVSFSNPHDPWEVPGRYWDRYARESIDAPTVSAPAPSEADPHSRRLRAMIGVDEAGLSDEQVLAARHGYYAAISYVDERIGDLLSALRDAGLADDTTVVLAADHGEMLGERGLWYKMSFFEPSARVPLIVSAPGRIAPGRRAQPVSLMDLAPTLLALAGLDPVEGMDGRSLEPLLHGPDAGDRSPSVVAEYLAEGVTSPAVMIRRGPHKFIRCEDDPDQLYDLESDPRELVNLAGRPTHAELHSRFRDEVTARWDMGELKRRVLASQGERRLIAEALATGRGTPWDFRPDDDASARYVRDGADLYELQRRSRLEAPGDS